MRHALAVVRLPLLLLVVATLVFASGRAYGTGVGQDRGTSARQPVSASQSKGGPPAPVGRSTTPGIDTQRLDQIDDLVATAIKDHQLPGAVVLVGRDDRIAYQKAFGNRAVEPSTEPMTLDTIFDLASLTKVVATTTSAMILIEEGRIRLSDRVAAYIPGFERYGKGNITIRQLMTHTSGLRPDLDMSEEFSDYKTAIARATEEIPTSAPGERFVYSDINYFLLGDIVARVSGMGLDKFAASRVFGPLGMRDTMFQPPASLKPRIAPTEKCTPLGWPCEGPAAVMMRGVVHDPTARRMGGVAGHAGLFGTAKDLSVFCRMLLGNGRVGQARILAPLSVLKMTTPATPPGQAALRGLGWDIDTSYSSNRGDLFPIGSYGHTGFTGTSLWLDPFTGTYVIFLSNRVHPDGKGDITPLRAKIASVVASAIADRVPVDELRESARRGGEFGPTGTVLQRPRETAVMIGIDVLEADGFKQLRGKRVGLVTNQTGRSRTGASTIDLLFKADGVKLVALFSPEHGIRGVLDETVDTSRDQKTGLPIYSLYGNTPESFRPTSQMLEGI
ncbi:MAG: serine hydrolase, partial [Bacteroidales bacterium]